MSDRFTHARTPDTDLIDEAATDWIRDQHGGWVPEQFDKATVVAAFRAGVDQAMDTGLTAGWCGGIEEARAVIAPMLQNLDARREGTLRSILSDVDDQIDSLAHPGGDELAAMARRARADRQIAGLALSLVQDLDDTAGIVMSNGDVAYWNDGTMGLAYWALRDALDAQAAPGQMSAAGVAAQERAVSEALDAGIDDISEEDEASIGRVADLLGLGATARLDSEIVDALRQSYEGGATFALTTADPRFSPTDSVMVNGYAFRPANGDGYVDAFYALAELLGVSEQPLTPREVWETQMSPMLKDALQLLDDCTGAVHFVNDLAAMTDDEIAAVQPETLRLRARGRLDNFGGFARFYTAEYRKKLVSVISTYAATGNLYTVAEVADQVATALGLKLHRGGK